MESAQVGLGTNNDEWTFPSSKYFGYIVTVQFSTFLFFLVLISFFLFL